MSDKVFIPSRPIYALCYCNRLLHYGCISLTVLFSLSIGTPTELLLLRRMTLSSYLALTPAASQWSLRWGVDCIHDQTEVLPTTMLYCTVNKHWVCVRTSVKLLLDCTWSSFTLYTTFAYYNTHAYICLVAVDANCCVKWSDRTLSHSEDAYRLKMLMIVCNVIGDKESWPHW